MTIRDLHVYLRMLAIIKFRAVIKCNLITAQAEQNQKVCAGITVKIVTEQGYNISEAAQNPDIYEDPLIVKAVMSVRSSYTISSGFS
jgi:hypothetical protein